MVVKKLGDTSVSLQQHSQQPLAFDSTQTLSSSTEFSSNITSPSSQEIKSNNSTHKFNSKTNLNKFISNSDILIKFNNQKSQSHHHHQQEQQQKKYRQNEINSKLPQRIFYENILSDLKNNQKSTLANNHINSNSTSSLNEQYILNFNPRNQFIKKSFAPAPLPITVTTRDPNNQSSINLFKHENSSTDEGLDEFIDEFNLEDVENNNDEDDNDEEDFGSSLSSTTSSSSQSNATNNHMKNRKSSNDNQMNECSFDFQPSLPPPLSNSNSKSADTNSSLSLSDLSGSPLSTSSTNQATCEHNNTTSLISNFANISVETDFNDEATNDICLLTPTQFSSFRQSDIKAELKGEDDDDEEESRRKTVIYSASSLLHEYQTKNNILNSTTTTNPSTTCVENIEPTANLDYDQNNLLLLRNELLNANASLSRQDSTKSKSKDSKLSSGKSTISSANSLFLACEVASLSSLTSDYSQFDFLANTTTATSNNTNVNSTSSTTNNNNNKIVLPVAETYHVDTPSKKSSSSNTNSNGSITSFFFSNSLFGNKKSSTLNTPEKSSPPTACSSANSNINPINSSQTHSQSFKLSTASTNFITTSTNPSVTSTSSNKTLDLIASKFFNLKSTSNKSYSKTTESTSPPPLPSFNEKKQKVELSLTTSSSSSSLANFNTDSIDAIPDNTSLKTNHSFNNLVGVSSIQVPSSVLIFENRPSNLPAKSQQEALKHKQEYEKMIQIAKKKEKKENQTKLKKYEQQMKKEDFMANSLKIWNNEILTNWNEQKNAKRTHQLWWHGLPPSIRGKVWKLAIGNELNLNKESYRFYEKKAQQKLEILSKKEEENETTSEKINESLSSSSSVELIKLDVSRTFPQLCFFQRDGPYHEALHSVLGAYACFNPQMGYVQGMSFLTAIFLLNMEAPDAFICLSNLLNTKYLLACFQMDQAKMNRYFRVHQILLEHNLPKLYRHFETQKVKPDLYLIEWIFTLFSKSLPLDVMSRVWDVFFRDKEEFLFRTALGILNMYKDTLLQMDFIHIVQFLTKLPENINSTLLFKSIEQIETSIDDLYFTFEHLIADTQTTPSTYHSTTSKTT